VSGWRGAARPPSARAEPAAEKHRRPPSLPLGGEDKAASRTAAALAAGRNTEQRCPQLRAAGWFSPAPGQVCTPALRCTAVGLQEVSVSSQGFPAGAKAVTPPIPTLQQPPQPRLHAQRLLAGTASPAKPSLLCKGPAMHV